MSLDDVVYKYYSDAEWEAMWIKEHRRHMVLRGNRQLARASDLQLGSTCDDATLVWGAQDTPPIAGAARSIPGRVSPPRGSDCTGIISQQATTRPSIVCSTPVRVGVEGELTMAQQLPTWNDMVSDAVTSLDDAQLDLAVALEWMDSDCSDGNGTVVHANRLEAAQLIGEAQQLIDRAKHALRSSAALRVV